MGYYGANAYHGVFADCHTAKDGTASTDAGSLFDERFLQYPIGILSTRIFVIRKRHIGADLHIILDGNAVPDLDAALDGDVIANHGFVLDEAVTADIAVLANLGVREDDAELPNVG